MAINKLNECKASVDNISGLDDTPTIATNELKAAFDRSGREIKEYLNETLIPHVNDEIIKGIENTDASIKALQTTVNNNKSDLNKVIPKVYTSESGSALNTSPKIVFSKTVPTTVSSNYGSKLPVGSIVFVY